MSTGLTNPTRRQPARQAKANLAQPTQRDGRSPASVAFRCAGRRATGNQCLQPPLLLDIPAWAGERHGPNWRTSPARSEEHCASMDGTIYLSFVFSET
jgi:hypothetical protein